MDAAKFSLISTSLSKGTTCMNLCLLPWMIYPFVKGVYSLRKEFAPLGANSFLLELTCIGKRSKKENDRLVPTVLYFFG